MDEFDTLRSGIGTGTKHHPEDSSEASEAESDSDIARLNREEEEEEGRSERSGRSGIPRIGGNDMKSKHSSHPLGSFQTGVKGVLSDARSYESALRRERNLRSSIHTGYPDSDSNPAYTSSPPEDASSEDFLATWRKRRLAELKTRSSSTRRRSPSKREFGRVETVDAYGYLDAVERVAAETVVVVVVYDDASELSRLVEDCLDTLARRYVTTRFVKMHYREAEMDVVGVPAVLGYRGGELFANIVGVVGEVPKGRSLSVESLELVLRRWNVLHKE